MDLKELEILGDDISTHWYYKSKALAIQKLLRQQKIHRVLDVGAGSGFFSKHLLRTTPASEAACVDTSYSEDKVEEFLGKTIRYVQKIDRFDSDVVLLMDVLEHVDNDFELLNEYVQMARRGTTFLITVPAFQFMWSGHDVFLDHRRRYTLNTLEEVVQETDLKIENISYFFGLVFPLAVIQRFFSKLRNDQGSAMKSHGKLLNKILFLLCALDARFFRLNRLAGLSVVCTAQKC